MRRTLDSMMADPNIPVIGDLMRLAFHASRFHADPRIRAATGAAIDRMLDRAGCDRVRPADVAASIAAARCPALAPMVADEDDIVLVARFRRYCHVMSFVLVGSADAVGAGHGVLLGAKKPFRARGTATNEICRLLLGTARDPARLALPHGGDAARFGVVAAEGAVVEIGLADELTEKPNMSECRIHPILGDGPVSHHAATLASSGLQLQTHGARGMRISARTPEGAIRLAAARASRALVHIPIGTEAYELPRPRGSFDLLVQLAPIDEAGAAAPCVRVSKTGPLADWMRMPSLAFALELEPDLRAAIAAFYART